MDSSALLAHIVSQTRQNIEFLISQRQISPSNGREILAKLPAGSDRAIAALEQQTQNLLITPPQTTPQNYPPPGVRQSPPVRARALWGYNEGQVNSNDLTFRAGDTIEIVAETNVDWWTGRYNGREGLFPSNYVEKLPAHGPPSPYQARDPYPTNNSSMPSYPNQPPYQAPNGVYSGPPYQAPPPPPGGGGYQPMYQAPPGPPQMGGPYNNYGPPPPIALPPQAPSQAPPPEQPSQKPSKMGGLGNTLAHSAVGGVGFGAGSAVGSGIINSIF
ncbi:SH3 domain-containing protein [Mycena belliarum]|uniref:SH3 domain-containing protein n=1 Tax=Mycena belliarum TaxID=1033014 RepID=A0AAD6XTF4_9AGAR|nr:SH3 domain-containing protein [Mycena belliae]